MRRAARCGRSSGSNEAGFDVTVTRKVYEHGKLLRRDATTSSYIAVGPTTIYGPGRSIPGPVLRAPAASSGYCASAFSGSDGESTALRTS